VDSRGVGAATPSQSMQCTTVLIGSSSVPHSVTCARTTRPRSDPSALRVLAGMLPRARESHRTRDGATADFTGVKSKSGVL
jgi:hypothetical protein